VHLQRPTSDKLRLGFSVRRVAVMKAMRIECQRAVPNNDRGPSVRVGLSKSSPVAGRVGAAPVRAE